MGKMLVLLDKERGKVNNNGGKETPTSRLKEERGGQSV